MQVEGTCITKPLVEVPLRCDGKHLNCVLDKNLENVNEKWRYNKKGRLGWRKEGQPLECAKPRKEGCAESIGTNYMKAVSHLHKMFTDPANGGRAGVKKVGIFLTDGTVPDIEEENIGTEVTATDCSKYSLITTTCDSIATPCYNNHNRTTDARIKEDRAKRLETCYNFDSNEFSKMNNCTGVTESSAGTRTFREWYNDSQCSRANCVTNPCSADDLACKRSKHSCPGQNYCDRFDKCYIEALQKHVLTTFPDPATNMDSYGPHQFPRVC